MKLTRRDAVLALVSGGLLAGTQIEQESSNSDRDLTAEDVDTLVAASEVLYPTEVETSREFVEAFVTGRPEPDHEYVPALDALRRTSRRRTGQEFEELGLDRRGAVIRATGADLVSPDPQGSTAEKIRYYVINDLLYALYSTPKGGKLVGNPNPMGYPGGIETYQRRPER